MRTRTFYVLVLTITLGCLVSQFTACNARETSGAGKQESGKRLSNTLTGTVVKISDGDTFHMLLADKTTVKVRLHGIDCPEKQQPFYQQARNALSNMIFKKLITIKWKKKDRYGRLLAIAYVNNVSVNGKMLRDGFAWHFKRYDNSYHWDSLQRKAQNEKVGLWSQPDPTAPWLFRQSKTRNQLCAL